VPLDKTKLQADVREAFQTAKDTPAPLDPNQSGEAQNRILEQLSRDLANAIDTYVRSGDINGVTVQVKDIADANVIGTGTQTVGVKIA
jgi:hypothetical protein